MAYYTFAHILQGGDIFGKTVGPVKPEELTKEVWDYILLNGEYPERSKIPKEILNKMKYEFEYWYGVDLRTSGKDLVQNHLTMFLYNHTAIFPKKYYPKTIFANGHVLVDGEKMSKSKGNFLTLKGTIETYTCDGTRIALASAGDGLDDANFIRQTADEAVLKIYNYVEWVKEVLEMKLRTGDKDSFADRVFEHKMKNCVNQAKKAYMSMRFKDALEYSWFIFQNIRDEYKVDVYENGMHHDLIMKFIELQCVIMYPITPHISEYIWGLIKKTSIHKEQWPTVEEADIRTIRSYSYYNKSVHTFRVKLEKEEETFKKKNKDKTYIKPTQAYIYVMKKYSDWQIQVLKLLREIVKDDPEIPKDVGNSLKGKVDPKNMENIMTFVSYIREEFKIYGKDALKEELPFDEKAIMNENIKFIEKTLGLQSVVIYNVEESNVPDPEKRIPFVKTGFPQITFIYQQK